MKRIIDPKKIKTSDLHQYIIGAVAPRPIAFVSSLNEDGVENLAPYSFFNAFSSNPPIVVFSSNRRVKDNSTKDTLHNAKINQELVINVVNYPIVRQMALSSVEFPSDVSEFTKVGLTPKAGTIVNAPLVAESPVNMECKVKDIITLGENGGAGHLIICEVLLMHIEEDVLGEKDRIDPHKIDLMGRMGRTYYVRASGNAVSEIYQSVVNEVIGWDGLPKHVLESKFLTGNEIAQMAALPSLPDKDKVLEMKHRDYAMPALAARELLGEGEIIEALALLMSTKL